MFYCLCLVDGSTVSDCSKWQQARANSFSFCSSGQKLPGHFLAQNVTSCFLGAIFTKIRAKEERPPTVSSELAFHLCLLRPLISFLPAIVFKNPHFLPNFHRHAPKKNTMCELIFIDPRPRAEIKFFSKNLIFFYQKFWMMNQLKTDQITSRSLDSVSISGGRRL